MLLLLESFRKGFNIESKITMRAAGRVRKCGLSWLTRQARALTFRPLLQFQFCDKSRKGLLTAKPKPASPSTFSSRFCRFRHCSFSFCCIQPTIHSVSVLIRGVRIGIYLSMAKMRFDMLNKVYWLSLSGEKARMGALP